MTACQRRAHRPHLVADTGAFRTWAAEIETFTCNSTPGHGGGEGSGEGGGEGGHAEGGEGGSEGGGEGVENAGPAIAINQATVARINGLDLTMAYDRTIQAFTGVLTNNSNQPICDARLEIHVNRGSSTIELGPTVDATWAPGQARSMVLGFDSMPTDTYSLHPETTACL